MLWNLASGWLLMAVSTVAVLGFFFGTALDAIMREDGFGAFGNMLLFTVGFFLAVFVANSWGFALTNMTRAVGTGLSGAFMLIAVLALGKAAVARL